MARSHGAIYGYILSLVGNVGIADDLMQDAALLMWEKFDDFNPGTDFTRWGCAFGKNIVRNYYRARRPGDVPFDDALLDRLVSTRRRMQELLQLRREALGECIDLLPPASRSMFVGYYQQESSIPAIASLLGRTPAAVYKALGRIRQILFKCINRKLGLEVLDD